MPKTHRVDADGGTQSAGAFPTVDLTHATDVKKPLHHDGWVYEEKVDGYRMVAYKDGDQVRLISRQGKDFTRRFAGLADAIRVLRFRTLILDGEVARYDALLVSRFKRTTSTWCRAARTQ